MMNRGCETPNASVYNRMASKTVSPLDSYQGQVPLSAPVNFKTPGKYASPGPKYKSSLTPKNPISTPRRCRTPSGPLYNPFDDGNLETMHLPTFSPNVFKVTSTPSSQKTPGKTTSTFRWSIDQQAILYPADIDEMPHHQEALVSRMHDERKEEEVQNAIDTFFSSNLIVPSPWTETPSTSRISRIKKDVEKDLSNSQGSKGSIKGNLQNNTEQFNSKKDMACQTTLTLPSGFDLQAILADYFTYRQQNDSADILSTSTLRRKLFCQGDQPANLWPSGAICRPAVSEEKDMTVDKSPSMSPLKYATPCRSSPVLTPSSAQFSSSPIRTGGARSSSCTRLERLSSPELSPISTPVSKRSSPGVRLQFTPSSERQSIILSSPDISPIKFENSFGQDEVLSPRHQEDEANTISPSIDHEQLEVQKRRDTIEMCFDAPEILSCNQSMDIDLSTSCNNAVAMLAQEPRLGNWGLSIIRECSDSERTNLDIGSCTGMTTVHQDTGYQTGSLQLTNQDIGILHSNLTQQMSTLPISSIGDLNSDNDCQSKVVDDSVLMSCSSSKRDFEYDKENIYSESGFMYGASQGKTYAKTDICSSENCSSGFPILKEHKPLVEISSNTGCHVPVDTAVSLEMCNTNLPTMVQSKFGASIFSWDQGSL